MPARRVNRTFTLVNFLLSWAVFTTVSISVYTRKIFTWEGKLQYLGSALKSKHSISYLIVFLKSRTSTPPFRGQRYRNFFDIRHHYQSADRAEKKHVSLGPLDRVSSPCILLWNSSKLRMRASSVLYNFEQGFGCRKAFPFLLSCRKCVQRGKTPSRRGVLELE